MAKISAKNKKSSGVSTRSKKKSYVTTKECFVNLIRLSKKELDIYAEPKVIVANFDLKISSDCIQIGDTQPVKHSASKTVNLTLMKRLSELVLEHCVEIPVKSITTPSQQSTNKTNIDSNCMSLTNTKSKIFIGCFILFPIYRQFDID